MSTGNLKYDEFVKLCDDAGIAADNPEEMEADYQTGAAVADIVSELEKTAAGRVPAKTPHEALVQLERHFDSVYDALHEGRTKEMKDLTVTFGADLIRFLADFCGVPTDS